MNHDAVPPAEYQAGGDSRRENLCQHERVNQTTRRASSSTQLEAAGPSSSGRLVAAEDPSNEKESSSSSKNSWGEIHQEVRRSCKEVRAPERGGARIGNQVLNSICASFKISRSTLRFGARLRATAYGLRLGLQRITLTSKKDGDEEKFSKDVRFDTVCTTTRKNIDRSQRRTQHANLAGLEQISAVKNYVAE